MALPLTLLTIGIPWIGALLVWLLGDGRERLQHTLAAGFALAGGAAALALLPFASSEAVLSIPFGGVFGTLSFTPDGLGVFLAAVASVVGSLAVIFSIDYMNHEAQLERYYALVLLFIGSMTALVLCESLLFIFLFWEMTAFCSYALISFNNDDPAAVAGGVKALIITQLGGIGLLAGAMLVYAQLGSYQIHDLLAGASTLPPGVLSLLAFGFLAAAMAKSAQVPLHTWLPDAMEAPTPISALIHAATMVNAGVYLLARFFPAFEAVPGWTEAVMIVGLLSAVLAAIMALVATDLKRTLAYSTISQLGYMVYAIGTGAVFASQFHLLSHAVFKALLFLGAGAVIHGVSTRDMRQMGGLGKQMPFTRTVFIIGAAALAGLPLANGFFSKELVLEYGLEHGPTWIYGLMLAGAGITALYSIRMVAMVFYGERRGESHAHPAGHAMRFSTGLLAAGTLTTWLLAGPFGHLLESTLPHHHLHVYSTGDLITTIISAPATWLAMAVVAAGLALWLVLRKALFNPNSPPVRFAQNGLGFEWLNGQISNLTTSGASALRVVQTGQLNWNVLGIVGGLVAVLIFLVWGA